MRVLGIVGSGRDGNTLELTENILQRMERYATAYGQEFEGEILKLKDLELPLCRSCHNCVTEKGEKYCPHREIVAKVEEKIQAADGIILASPVSSLQVTGLMKNLIDHFSFYFHRPRLFDKYGLALTNTAGAGHKASGRYLQSVLHAWGIGKPQILPLMLANVKVVMDNKMDRRLERAARKFYFQISHRKASSPSLYDIIYYSVWRGFISTGSPKEADYDYWQKHGWLDQNYYYTSDINPVKLAIGGLFYRLLRRTFAKQQAQNERIEKP